MLPPWHMYFVLFQWHIHARASSFSNFHFLNWFLSLFTKRMYIIESFRVTLSFILNDIQWIFKAYMIPAFTSCAFRNTLYIISFFLLGIWSKSFCQVSWQNTHNDIHIYIPQGAHHLLWSDWVNHNSWHQSGCNISKMSFTRESPAWVLLIHIPEAKFHCLSVPV